LLRRRGIAVHLHMPSSRDIELMPLPLFPYSPLGR
jgi:hypothetical protein